MLVLGCSAWFGQDCSAFHTWRSQPFICSHLLVKERTAPDGGSPGLAPGGGVVEPPCGLVQATSLQRVLVRPPSPSLLGELPGTFFSFTFEQQPQNQSQGGEEEEEDARLARDFLMGSSQRLLLGGANSVTLQFLHSPE